MHGNERSSRQWRDQVLADVLAQGHVERSSFVRASALTLHGCCCCAVLSSMTAGLCTILHLDDSIVCPKPLRSGGRISKAKPGELNKIHALLLLLRPLLQSGSLRSVLETAAESAALALTPFGNGVQRQRQEVVEEGWKRV